VGWGGWGKDLGFGVWGLGLMGYGLGVSVQGLGYTMVEGQLGDEQSGFSYQFENNYFTEMCSGSEAGSHLRLIDFVFHSTSGLRVIKKRRTVRRRSWLTIPVLTHKVSRTNPSTLVRDRTWQDESVAMNSPPNAERTGMMGEKALAGYSQVDMLGFSCRFVNFGAGNAVAGGQLGD